jgi:adenylate cyclase
LPFTPDTRAREEIETRLLDLVIVKGQTHPANIYELIGRKGEVDSAYLEATALYEKALRLHWAREWDKAEVLLSEAMQVHKDDAPSVMLRHRIGNYQIVPPPEEWGGEFIRVRK